MSVSIRRLVGGLGLALLGGCLPAREAPPLPAPADAAGRRAAELRQTCAGAPSGAMECYSERLLALLPEVGVTETLATLERLAERDPAVPRDGHMYVHAIGLAAYSSPATVAQTFRECTPLFQSGCYHGVVQAYFADLVGDGGEIDRQAVDALCSDYRERPSERWLLFQCVHGLGHGLTMYHGYHLPRALQGCDLLPDEWEREGCYGGAFMENVVQATTPHHAVGRPGTGGGDHAHGGEHHGGHHGAPRAEHAAAPAPAFKPLDPEDPLYPCSVLEERYLNSCYQMQTSAVLHFNGGDVAAAAGVCDTAPREYRPACYLSLGRDISALTLQKHSAALRLCSLGDPKYRSWCHVGYAKNLVDLTADVREALAYCRVIPDREGKLSCHQAVGEEVWVLSDEPARREAYCAGAEPGYRDACRAGAGLVARSPEPTSGGSGR